MNPKQPVKSSRKGLKLEPWTRAQVEFMTTARVRARQALYFVRLYEPDSTAFEHIFDNARIAVTKLQSLAPNKWHVDSFPRELTAELAAAKAEAEKEAGRASVDDRLGYTGAFKPFTDLITHWEHIRTTCEGEQTLENVRKLESQLLTFLKESRPKAFWIRFTYVRIPALGVVVKQHIGYVTAASAALAIGFGVEAVRSLILNSRIYSLVAFLSAVILPFLVLQALARRARSWGKTPFWDHGGRLYRSVCPVPLAPQRWVPRHASPNVALTMQRSLLLKFMLYALLWVCIGFFYALAVRFFGIDDIKLTVYAIAVLMSLLVFIGSAGDFVDIHSQAPIRLWLLGGTLVLLIILFYFDRGWLMLLAPAAWLLLASIWTWHVRHKRVLPLFATIALLVMLSLGTTTWRRGGDLWPQAGSSAPALLGLDAWPRNTGQPVVVMAASGGGSRAAILTALTLDALARHYPHVDSQLQAISSVSGGSLAAAAHAAHRIQRARTLPDRAPGCRHDLVTRAQQDFLWPTIMGLVTHGRGRAIERAWEQCPVGLGELTVGDLGRLWQDSARWPSHQVPFAIPVFNSVTLDRHGVVISPLGQKYFELPFDPEARGDSTNAYRNLSNPTWVFYRSGIYHLNDLVSRFDPRLSSAVRASANFPFGFPLVDVRVDGKLFYSPRKPLESGPEIVSLTDGGALSNSGMWSLGRMLMRQHERIGARGVLLIIVDASRMPPVRRRNRQRELFGTIMDKNPKGERLHLEMLEQLSRQYPGCFAAVQISLNAEKDLNVYTTWALDDTSMDKLTDGFASAWSIAGPSIDTAYSQLQSCKSKPVQRGLPRRLPLS